MDFDVKLACKAESMSNSPSDGHPSFLAGYAGQEDTPSALLHLFRLTFIRLLFFLVVYQNNILAYLADVAKRNYVFFFPA